MQKVATNFWGRVIAFLDVYNTLLISISKQFSQNTIRLTFVIKRFMKLILEQLRKASTKKNQKSLHIMELESRLRSRLRI